MTLRALQPSRYTTHVPLPIFVVLFMGQGDVVPVVFSLFPFSFAYLRPSDVYPPTSLHLPLPSDASLPFIYAPDPTLLIFSLRSRAGPVFLH